MTPHRCPASLDELRTLRVTVKPHWKAWWLRLVGPVIVAWSWLDRVLGLPEPIRKYSGLRAATRFLYDFWTVAGGWNHAPRGFAGVVPKRLELHEGVHDWQKRTRRLHDVRYTLIREYTRHCEAQAYAVEVAMGLRTLEVAARSMADPIYAMGLSVEAAEGWILAYVARWRRDCTDIREQTQ